MPNPDENHSPTNTPTEWATPSEIPDGMPFASRDSGGHWIRDDAGYRYTATDGRPGALWTADDIAEHAPFIPVEG